MSNMKISVPDGILTFDARFKGYIRGKVQQKRKIQSLNAQPHADGKSGEVSRPRNISGKSQENGVAAIMQTTEVHRRHFKM